MKGKRIEAEERMVIARVEKAGRRAWSKEG